MEYETFNETNLKPFSHDKNRGKWASSKDFFFVCAGHAFKADAVVIMPIFVFDDIGIYALIPYLTTLTLCVVPIVFLQSFLGQFSSTGFISVFRISPLFKGLGYVSLVVNFSILTYYSIFSAIPLFYLFHSLRPTIPWSCEGWKEWTRTSAVNQSFCVHSLNENQTLGISIPSIEFFIDHLNIAHRFNDQEHENSFSVQLMVCTCIIWGIVAFVLLKPTELIGRIIRYSFLSVVTIMTICLLRFVFLPGVIDGLWEFLVPKTHRFFQDMWFTVPNLALSTLGPGWGTILTMASFNNFKTNISKYSWLLCLAQFGLMIGMAFLSIFIKLFMKSINAERTFFFRFHDTEWMNFLSIPTSLTFLELPHFWSLLFFSMWILGSLNILIIQLLSLLTSLFDEFEKLREIKRAVIFGAVGILLVTSILFCSNHGVYFFEILSKYSIVTQMVLNLLLLLVVLWIYGRERFQRDLNFMTSRNYSTWMVYIVRFVAPVFLLLGLFIGMLFSFGLDGSPSSLTTHLFTFGTLMFLFPWCLIPGYCIFKIIQTTGGKRLRRCVRPTDWYPADPVDRQRYEENFNRTAISHELTTDTMQYVY